MHTLLGMPVNVKYHKIVIALTSYVIHGTLILNSRQVLLRSTQWVLEQHLTPRQYL